tara:strand:+ start:145 stop:390 length:246 start_codon:yes stop_codon:yes gene_type:complete
MKHRYHINLLIDSELDIDRVKELFELNCGVVERIKMSEFTSEEGKKHIGTINKDDRICDDNWCHYSGMPAPNAYKQEEDNE